MFHRYMTGYTFYDCGCPHIAPASWDSHGQASEKLLDFLHKLLCHKNGFSDEIDWDFDDYDDGIEMF